MKTHISIYLAGSIQKGHEKNNDSYWTDADMQSLRESLAEFQLSFLNPAFRTDDLSDQRSVFGRDMLQVFSSDIVFVDARHRRGLGVGAEMMWAKVNRIPVVTLAPKDTHYSKTKTSLLGVEVEKWVHPFVESLSDHIAEDLSDGARWIREAMNGRVQPVKDIEWVRSCMGHFIDNQLEKDHPMRDLISSNPDLTAKLEALRGALSL
ncbi:MAG: hypothetical protein JSR39_11260 [Verrucomicrobia bacterium]|nr:hypothetical protein [Verrucomicrobiota bacterium]